MLIVCCDQFATQGERWQAEKAGWQVEELAALHHAHISVVDKEHLERGTRKNPVHEQN